MSMRYGAYFFLSKRSIKVSLVLCFLLPKSTESPTLTLCACVFGTFLFEMQIIKKPKNSFESVGNENGTYKASVMNAFAQDFQK